MKFAQRLFYLPALAIVEATPAALVLAILNLPGAWAVLLLVALAGAGIDWLIQRVLRAEHQRPVLVVLGGLLALWVAKSQSGGDYGFTEGWGATISRLFNFSDPYQGIAYVALLAGLYVFWRGTNMLAHDAGSLRDLFGRTTGAVLALLLIAALLGQPADATGRQLLTLEVLALFATGLITIALASAAATPAQHDGTSQQGMGIVLGAIGLVIILALVSVSIFGQEAARAITALWEGFVLLLTLILLPIIFVLASILEWIFSLLPVPIVWGALREFIAALESPFQGPRPDQSETSGLLPPWADTAGRVIFALLPVLILVVVIILARRHAPRRTNADEERESLWSSTILAADLHDLLALLRGRGRPENSLRTALGRLRGDDPITRIRRSYIKFLLAGEARSHPRAPEQTPHEYKQTADTTFPAATRSIDRLTESYERARYRPDGVSETDAADAEQAWDTINRAG